MITHRRERGGSFIKEELTLLLRNALQDERVHGVSIVDVDLTPDRRVARVYISSYESEESLQLALQGLEHAKGFLRRGLAGVLHWPFTPHLEFRVDRSWQHGERIDALLDQIAEEESTKQDAHDPGTE
jgi:ribosome-binding factor A